MKNFSKIFRPYFPQTERILESGKKLVYFDNGATSLCPYDFINFISHYYTHDVANVHRGIHELSNKGTDAFEHARVSVAEFCGAKHSEEIIFTKGTTESINLVATCLSRQNFFKEGDEILLSIQEHHANLVCWQEISQQYGVKLKFISLTPSGELNFEEGFSLVSKKTKLLALSCLSHVTGIYPCEDKLSDLAQEVKNNGGLVLIDGAQGITHHTPCLKELPWDFYCFSAHKLYGPFGLGILYGKKEALESFPPYQFGGSMIETVSLEKSTYNKLPFRLEAGTPPIAQVLSFSKVLSFLQQFSSQEIKSYKEYLGLYLQEQLLQHFPKITLLGHSLSFKTSLCSFTLENCHPQDLGHLLDAQGIAVRTGHHCAWPLMDFFKVKGCLRVSLAPYNTIEEIDFFIESLKKSQELLQ